MILWIRGFGDENGHHVPMRGQSDIVAQVHEGNGGHQDEDDNNDSFDGVIW